MSVLAAAATLDAGPGAGAIVDRLLAAMAGRAPDGQGRIAAGRAALGYGFLRTLPERGAGAQPAWARNRSCVAVLEGRLDNRDEIAKRAGVSLSIDTGDAALAAELYAARGEEAFTALLGDFAVALWDERRQHLLLARDVCGARPLYVWRGPNLLAAATELQALARLGSTRINEGGVGEALTGTTTSLVDTLYQDISRVPPGHLVLVRGGAAATRRYTDFQPLACPPRTDEDWADELRTRLVRAVRVRARAAGPVGVMLSGGRDSGVLLTAARAGAAPDVTAWTLDGPPAANEVPFARETARALGVPLRVTPPTAAAYDYAASAARFCDRAIYPSGANSLGLRRAAAAEGVRVLLSGAWGDELLGTNAWHCADLLAAGRLIRLARAWRTLRTTTDAPAPRDLLQATVVPCVPRSIRGALARMGAAPHRYPWIDSRFQARIALADRLRARPPAGGLSAGAYAHRLCLAGGDAMRAAEETDLLQAESGTEERPAYLDRQLIELAQAVPPHLLAAAPEQKLLARLAFTRELPASLVHPREALRFEYLLVQALDRIGGARFFRRLLAEEAGWVNGPWVRDRLAAVWPVVGPPDWEAASALWNVAAVELWLRHEQRRPAQPNL
jgi:asparagine synthase (glutamine-hydrolysing)